MLDAPKCFLAGLCFFLLAISAAALTSSTFFCCTFLALLLFGFLLFARLIISSQAKLVAVKRHRKRGRLKTDTVATASIGSLAKDVLAKDITMDSCSLHKLWISDGIAIFSMWPKCQQDAFCKAARSSSTRHDQKFLAVYLLTKL
jgi:uncharacterized membrane protein YciS (DUF1049 family)